MLYLIFKVATVWEKMSKKAYLNSSSKKSKTDLHMRIFFHCCRFDNCAQMHTKKSFPVLFFYFLATMLRTTIFVILAAFIVLVASEAEPEPEGEGEYAAAAESEAEAEGGSATLTSSLLSLAFSLAFNAILRH